MDNAGSGWRTGLHGPYVDVKPARPAQLRQSLDCGPPGKGSSNCPSNRFDQGRSLVGEVGGNGLVVPDRPSVDSGNVEGRPAGTYRTSYSAGLNHLSVSFEEGINRQGRVDGSDECGRERGNTGMANLRVFRHECGEFRLNDQGVLVV